MNEQNTTLKKAMIEALTKSLGIVTHACDKVGIARSTHYTWFNEDKEYKKEVESIKDVAIDYVESKLYGRIDDEDTTAMIFFLKTQGKSRGYIEKQIIENNQHIKMYGIETPIEDV